MHSVVFQQQEYQVRPDETLLEALLRQGCEVSFSCKKGACHTCLLRATQGTPPAEAQRGLNPVLQAKGYLLPCLCTPEEDLQLALPDPKDLLCTALIQEKTKLAPDIYRLLIEPMLNISYRPGQFINIHKDEHAARSYSLASVPGEDYFLELHVRHYADGQVSNWLTNQCSPGDEILISQASGNNHYQSPPEQPLLLAGSGTGLAPLLGIVRDALLHGHQGRIDLYHAAADQAGLYGDEQLLALARQHANFNYHPCPSTRCRLETILQSTQSKLHDHAIHLAGNPSLVHQLSALCERLGARPDNIHCDPFEPPAGAQSGDSKLAPDETPYPPPSPDLWEALEHGAKLQRILYDFYDRVFEDPILSPFFHNTTKTRAKEKVYSFYRRQFSGEKVYFGDRPRNAHHWMVITDDIFDHRKEMLRQCMQEHGLAQPMIDKWLALEERYRGDLVKDKPRGRMVDGKEAPAEGYDSLVLDDGTLCDGCHQEVTPGTEIHYHLRTGQVYCPGCFDSQKH